MKRLRVLVLMHEDLVPPESIEDLSDEQVFPWKMEYDVLSALEELGHEVLPLGLGNEILPIRNAIEEFRPHIAFNLLMHFHGLPLYDAYVVSYLELLRIPYTGCNPRGLLLASDKALSKKVLSWHRIPVPPFTVVRRGRVARMPRGTSFPLIVKSATEHASIGIAQASVVHDEKSLRERVEFVHESVGTPAIVESYVAGREFTIGVLGNDRLTVLPLWETVFKNLPEHSEPIITSRAKWDLRYQKKIGLDTGPAEDVPEAKVERIRRLAKRIYRALHQSGFARIDLRMDEEERVWVLETNPNPDLCYGEDFAEAAERIGIGYPELVQRLLRLGLRRKVPG